MAGGLQLARSIVTEYCSGMTRARLLAKPPPVMWLMVCTPAGPPTAWIMDRIALA
ncbi:Uncharacterised protein [Mycobacteroides abscessus subsp. abscessus]|nr:Uncharacterised protein [Mycobacteroides abscessus subsp. abscessus]